MDYIVGMITKLSHGRIGFPGALLASLLALDAYVEIVGNPTGAEQAALTKSVLEKFESNWGHLRARFKPGTPPRDNPYKVRVIFDVPQSWGPHALCAEPANQFPANSSERLHIMVLFCGDGPLSEIRGSLKRPASLTDPALQKSLNFLIWQFVVEHPQRGTDCDTTSSC